MILYKEYGFRLIMNCTPFVIQYTILSDKWGAVQLRAGIFLYFVQGIPFAALVVKEQKHKQQYVMRNHAGPGRHQPHVQ